MNTLEKIQHHFQHFLLSTHPDIRQDIATPHQGSSSERLGVYAEAYMLRLLEALAVEFAALKNFMGQNQFNKMGETYFRRHPSTFYAVRYLGSSLPEFLADYDPARPYLRELAIFEIQLSNAIDAPNATLKTSHDLSSVPAEKWGEMRFKLHPSVTLVDFEWDIPSLWKSATEKKRQKPAKKITHVSVWRKKIETYYFSKDENETRMLNLLQQGENFATMCETLIPAISEEQAPQFAANKLLQWLNEEMISDIYF